MSSIDVSSSFLSIIYARNFRNSRSCRPAANKKVENPSVTALFHHERGVEHFLFLLLTFPGLKYKQVLSKVKQKINKTNKEYSTPRL